MKRSAQLICAVLLGLASGLSGQTNMISSMNDMITFMNSDVDYIKNKRDRYSKIEGSAYLDEAFHGGSISFSHKKYTGLQLRFNPYEGYFEFQTTEGIKFFDPQTTLIDTVWIDEEIFLYVPYNSGKLIKRAYMRMMNPGKTIVLQLSQVILIEAKAAKGYEEATPAHFEKRSETIFIRTGDQPAMEFKGRKSLEDIFPEHFEVLTEYAKAEKLKLKKTGEIINICAFYDSLH